MELNRGDYVKLTNAEAEEVGVVWEINPKNAASVEVYWWNGGHRWSSYYDPQSLSLVPPTEIPDYAIKLKDSLGLQPEPYRQLCRRVLERDGWRCQYCGRIEGLQVHHIQPRSRLGHDSDENLIALCASCHQNAHLHGYVFEKHK